MTLTESTLDTIRFEIAEEIAPETRIKVIGVGGGGSNAVARMMAEGLAGIEFHVLNTDQQALGASPVPNKLAIGAKITNGLGVGCNPEIGRQAALEDTERIIEILEGADMVFVTAGLGGGVGTGAAPVIASLAKELNALTVAVVTRPFSFEGPRRMRLAEKGLNDLAETVDTVITIPNDRLLDIVPRGATLVEGFRVADDVLRQAVQGISDIITTPGLINRDFSDVRAIMAGMGYAMMGTATARGEGAALEAARKAIECPLLEDGGVRGARGLLINITSSSQLGLHDVHEACTLIGEATANDDLQINFGVVLNEAMRDEVKITVIATGFTREGRVIAAPRARAAVAAAQPVFSTPVYEPPIAEPIPMEFAPATEMMPPPPPAQDPYPEVDIDTPAFLRRERRLFQ